MSRSKDNSTAREISAFRKRLKLTRSQFAEQLKISNVAVLRWEQGDRQPSPGTYIEFAKLAQRSAPELLPPFLARAGLDMATLRSFIPEITQAYEGIDKKLRAGSHAKLPILRSLSHVDAPALAPPDDIEGWLSLPSSWIPNPLSTGCLRPFPHSLSSARSYIYGPDDVLVLDSSQKDLNVLAEKMVAVYSAGQEGAYAPGLRLGWLRSIRFADREMSVLFPQRNIQETIDTIETTEAVVEFDKGRAQVWPWLVTSLAQGDWVYPVDVSKDDRVLGRVLRWIISDESAPREHPLHSRVITKVRSFVEGQQERTKKRKSE